MLRQVVSSEALTAAIVSRLVCLADILRCSAVCKTWHTACCKLQLQALSIPGDWKHRPLNSYWLNEDGLHSTVRLVQQWHTQGTFQNLTSLSLRLELECTAACLESGQLPGFLRSILTVAGMWENLQHCLINADVDMELPASLLPSTLQSLNLSFRSHRTSCLCRCCKDFQA